MDRFFFVTGSLLAFLAVALGAFAAHSLKARLSADMLTIFETGVRYHMYHALALLAVAWAAGQHWNVPVLSIDDMARTHGLANALAVVQCGLLARHLSSPVDRTADECRPAVTTRLAVSA